MSLYGYKKKYKPALWKQRQLLESRSQESVGSNGSETGFTVSKSNLSKTGSPFSTVPAQHKPTFKRLRKRSKKMSRILLLYNFLRDIFLARNPMCCAPLSSKPVRSDEVHHLRGRLGTLLLDVRYWKAVSRARHEWIGRNVSLARSMGLLCQRGEWNNAPYDEITSELKAIILCAKLGQIAEAKRRLLSLVRSKHLLDV